MNVLPVLDLMNGVVVRGIGGRREEYRPVVSQLTRSADPLSVARAFRVQLGLATLYLADLDAIRGGTPSCSLYDALMEQGFSLWIDPGIRDASQASELSRRGINTLVVGLETLPDGDTLQRLREGIDPRRMVVSLDMKNGQPLTPNPRWRGMTLLDIAEEIIDLGFTRLLLLDLARVGSHQGPVTEELGQTLLARHGHALSLATGGGVRNRSDLFRLKQAGFDACLVASALHDGAITRADVVDVSAPLP